MENPKVIHDLDRTRVRIRQQRYISLSFLSQTVATKAALLVPANPAILDGVNDLTSLSYLNEPSILHDLQQRYTSDQVCAVSCPKIPHAAMLCRRQVL